MKKWEKLISFICMIALVQGLLFQAIPTTAEASVIESSTSEQFSQNGLDVINPLYGDSLTEDNNVNSNYGTQTPTGGSSVTPGAISADGTLLETFDGQGGTISNLSRASTAIVSGIALAFSQEYPKVGEAFTLTVGDGTNQEDYTYNWTINSTTVSTMNSYTPTVLDSEKELQVTVSLDGTVIGTKSVFISNLPVAYIETENSAEITSKEYYINGTFKIQGNSQYNLSNTKLYDGAIEIKGRGNSTWGQKKKPYKIKLDNSTNLFGMGKNKHWVLLANYMDETHLRNKLSYELSGKMGMTYVESTYVEVVLNGEYIGLYQLCEQIRIADDRLEIFNWSDVAKTIAKAVVKANLSLTEDDQTNIEDFLNIDLRWMTSGTFTYNEIAYNVATYYPDIPATTGGFLIELDAYWDELSKFKTDSLQPIQLKEPEYLYTNQAVMDYLQGYIQDFEDSVHGYNFYSDTTGKHYTELADEESLINDWVINELFFNTETAKKSFYMYKDIGGLLYFGPIWDMDWSSNSDVSAGETNYPTDWMTIKRSTEAQANSWYKYLIKDPYFTLRAYEAYQQYKTEFHNMIASGGDMEILKSYIQKAAEANYALGTYGVQHTSKDFDAQVANLKSFMNKRITWLDQQFADVTTLYNSLQGGVTNSLGSKITVTIDSSSLNPVATVKVNGISNAAKVAFYVNGKKANTVAISNGTALTTINNSLLTTNSSQSNIVTAYILDSTQTPISTTVITNTKSTTVYAMNFKTFVGTVIPGVTGTVTINGTAKVGSTLTAVASDSNNTGTLSYQWYADSQKINGANDSTYVVRPTELGKTIYVEVTSSVETGSIKSTPTEATKDVDIVIKELTGTVSINGTAKVGSTLTAIVSNSNNTGSLSYQWYVDSHKINNANDSTYVVRPTELGKTLYVEVISSVETGAIKSAPTEATKDVDIVINELTGNVNINGSAKVGSTLTAVVNDSNNTGTLSYQWYADSQKINGANDSTYVVRPTELGMAIYVEVTSSVETGAIISAPTVAVTEIVIPTIPVTPTTPSTGGSSSGDTSTSPVVETPIVTEIKTDNEDKINITQTKDAKGNITITMDILESLNDELQNNEVINNQIKLQKALIQSIKSTGKNITITVKNEDGKVLYIWFFNGKELLSSKQAIKDTLLGITLTSQSNESILKDVITKDTNIEKSVLLNFAQTGSLPSNATIKLYVGNQLGLKATDTVYVYSLNRKTDKLEELPQNKYTIDKNNYITINVTRGGYYVLTTTKPVAKVVTTLASQASIRIASTTLKKGKTTKVKLTLPVTLEKVSSLKKATISSRGVMAVTITYSSSNNQIATVSKTGTITGKNAGIVSIYVTIALSNGKSETFTRKIMVN